MRFVPEVPHQTQKLGLDGVAAYCDGCQALNVTKTPFSVDGFYMRLIDHAGKRYGRLVAVVRVNNDSTNRPRWLCLCDCGDTLIVKAGHLQSGHTKSCGCLRVDVVGKRATKHGLSKSKEYNTWCHVWQRCYSKRPSKDKKNYHDRGIAVCERWRSFENFLADMGLAPTPQHSIERVDNEGNYEPNNCVWATPTEQAQNRRARKGTVNA